MRCRLNHRSKRGCLPLEECPGGTLKELISHFRQNHLRRLRANLIGFQQKSLNSVIELVANAKNPDGSRHSHHTRKKQHTLNRASIELHAAKTILLRCKSFSQIFEVIERLANNISGLGPLFIYDCALHLGFRLGHQPKLVHLHAGTRIGAKALGLNVRDKAIVVPRKLSRLKPHEVEDFLCIYKDFLKPSMLA